MKAVAPTQAAAAPAVTSNSSALLQRQCACGQHTGGGKECDDCKKKKLTLHRRATTSFTPRMAPGIVQSVLRSPGRPLDAATRAVMEPRFERDFRHVRIHTDAQAAESADAVHADAYTVGHHIVFSDGQYSGASWKSRQLLQHELVHTIQQSHVSDEHIRAAEGKLEIGDSHGPLERQARAHDAETEMTSEVGAGGSNGLLQRQG